MCHTARKASGLQQSQRVWPWHVHLAARRDLCTFTGQGGISEPALEQPGYRGGTGCLECHILPYESVSEPPRSFLHIAGSLRFFPLLICFIVHPLPFSCVLNGASEVARLTFMPAYHARTAVYQHRSLVVPGLRKQHRSTAAAAEQVVWAPGIGCKLRGQLLLTKVQGSFAL